jgi:hypothetical protein
LAPLVAWRRFGRQRLTTSAASKLSLISISSQDFIFWETRSLLTEICAGCEMALDRLKWAAIIAFDELGVDISMDNESLERLRQASSSDALTTERNREAAERTLLAWIRTCFSLI